MLRLQISAKINVIISNPPWRVAQKDATDFNANMRYEHLEASIKTTYAAKSKAVGKNRLYDQYVKAVRFASDRIGEKGVIAFVLNNGFLDAVSFDGFRAALAEEFSEIFIVNLRGNARTKEELRKREGGGVFGQKSRAGVALVFLVKNPTHTGKAKILYWEVHDYLKTRQKLALLKEFKSIENINFRKITPDKNDRWIKLGRREFEQFYPLDKIFKLTTPGVATARDAWVYDFFTDALKEKMRKFIDTFNEQLELIRTGKIKSPEQLCRDKTRISWSQSLINAAFRYATLKNYTAKFEDEGEIRRAVYRPFVHLHLYYSKLFVERPRKFTVVLPRDDEFNRIIYTAASGKGAIFAAILEKYIGDLHIFTSTLAIPLYTYDGGRRKGNVRDSFLHTLKDHIGDAYLTADTDTATRRIFYYTFAILASREYAQTYAENLEFSKPRIPLPPNPNIFLTLANLGEKLGELLANWETTPAPQLPISYSFDPDDHDAHTPPFSALSTEAQIKLFTPEIKIDKNNREIQFNRFITIHDVPPQAFDWKIGGYAPIEWFAKYTKKRIFPDSNITWDPANLLRKTDQKDYFLKTALKIIHTTTQAIELLNQIDPIVKTIISKITRSDFN